MRMRFGTWNVRTMRTGFPDTSGSSDCTQHLRKTAVIDAELWRLNIAVAALQETRLPDEGSLRETNYTFYWKGKESSESRQHGVGFAVRNDLLSAIDDPRGVSERIMTCRLSTSSGFVTLISAYAPTLKSSPESKDLFYDQLCETLSRVRSGDRLIILGDFNARVGQSHASWPDCMGSHGVGTLNENGQRLLEFCSQNLLCVTNTYFKGKFMHKVSWKHPRSKHWHQLDTILTRKKNLGDILHTRTFHSADCDTDHSLVVTTASFCPKKIHSSRSIGSKKLKVPTSTSRDEIASYQQLIKEESASWDPDMSASEEWVKIKSILTETAAKAFGYKPTSKHDWFQENIDHLQPFLDLKRQASLNYRQNPTSTTRGELSKAKADLQRNVRFCANSYWLELCKSIQSHASTGNFSGVYSVIKKALGPLPNKTARLKEADGSCILDADRQLHRWVEHYSNLYSQPIGVEPEAVQMFPELPVCTELDAVPTVEQFITAINQLKRGKSPGIDGVLAEILKTCILSILLYGAETWTSYAKQERRLNNFHMRCLRRILDISWKDRVTNEKVLSMACIPSITALLKQRRLRWLGHVQRMEPSRLPRQTLLGQISDAKRPVGRPLLRFKDSVKRDMVSFKIDRNIWEKLSDDRDSWRKKISDGVVAHDSAWFDLLSKKRDLRHQRMAQPPTSPGTQFVCGRCDRRCRSRIGLVSHQRKCQSQTT
ncbi:hypothetical protein B5X24_HaOG213343 [Helicoverpa armigera]|uniref:Endonuclease/exonuclease/phosphatase domain-containing protein n=1 Tax=Helicoverpa armigera TaxID=29058 RepID=A0A2W1BFD4_HELAM|nr:hypothetical protein B5X24_HaOG213343 [Helicoverpa armigera]